MRYYNFTLLFLVIVALPSILHAQTTFNVATDREIPLSITNGDKIATNARGGRSYCCFFTVADGGFNAMQFSGATGFSSEGLASAKFRGNDSELVGLNVANAGATFNRRVCWNEGNTTNNVNVVSTIGGASGDVVAKCEETTLIGGFNTSVTDFNFLELTATGRPGEADQAISGTVIIRTTVSNQEFSIGFTLDPGNEDIVRQDVSIHDAIGNIKDFGQVLVLHNAAPGQLKAKVTQYRIVTQAPLDFEPVLQEIFVPRNQN